MKESKEKKDIIDLEKNHSIIEKYFERALWGTRYVVVMAAVFSTLSAITLFFIGSYEIIEAITSYCLSSVHESSNGHGHKKILASFIGGIDLYLIGVVLLIFGFGIYELFVSKIDIARMDADVTILEVENIDELKNKIIKVIIMVLIVSFFERVLNMQYGTPLEMMYFAFSIFALAFGVYIINKNRQ